MAIKLSQNLKQTQSLMMTPQLQQSIKMLTLNHAEISDLISNELVENPLLEDSKSLPSDSQSPDLIEKEIQETDPSKLVEKNIFEKKDETFDWESYLESSGEEKAVSMRDPEETFNYENIISSGENLSDHFKWQLKIDNLTTKEWEIAEFIIGNLNEDGYLVIAPEDISKELKTSMEDVSFVLEKIQRLDPIGCGSKDLIDCLLVQINILGISSPLLRKIINFHLKDVQTKKYEEIAKSCGNTFEEVLNAVEMLNQLHPKPGRLVATPDTHYIVPDVFIYEVNGEFKVKINDEGIPRLKISKTYLKLLKPTLKNETEKERNLRIYIKEKLKNAEWFINSINKRQSTIFQVAESIVRYQQDFFKKGPEYLKPLTLKVIAEEVGVHESTVSRATSNKYMQTPLGVFELKYFFKAGIGAHDGNDVSSEVLKVKIKNFISMESKKRPFSDQKISDLLKREGILVARRTIAKYREELEIPPSKDRKL